MEQILQSMAIVIPIIFVLAFGFVAGKRKSFGIEGNPLNVLNELVLKFALPPALFVGTVTVSRTSLIQELNLFFSLFITLLIAYLVGFFFAKFCFKRNTIEASIAGLAVSFCAGPFYGPALLGSLYGIESGVAVSMISVVINVCIVPLATVIIKMALANEEDHHSIFQLVGESLYQAIFKTPFVWAPLLAFVLVFLNIQMSHVVINSLELIGKATAGVAVFVAGMTIAANQFKISSEVICISLLKNIGVPLLFMVIAVYLFKMQKHMIVFDEGLLLAALPSGPMIVLLATRYKQYQAQASSILAITTVGMLITVTALIVLIHP